MTTTADELKLKIDAYFGMDGKMTQDGDSGEIEYFSPTGIPLLYVRIATWKGQWEVGSAGQRCLGDDLERATGSGRFSQ